MGVEGIGASVVRKEDRRFITGKGRYVDDIKLQGMTHAHFVRSPHAHAKVKSIDTSAAMKMPGVVGVLTGKEIVDLLRDLNRTDGLTIIMVTHNLEIVARTDRVVRLISGRVETHSPPALDWRWPA